MPGLNTDASYIVAHTCICISTITEKIETLHKYNSTIISVSLDNANTTKILYLWLTDGHGWTEMKDAMDCSIFPFTSIS